jgi:hypothetical protein
VLPVAALKTKSWTILEPRTASELREHPASCDMRAPFVSQLSVTLEIFNAILVDSFAR